MSICNEAQDCVLELVEEWESVHQHLLREKKLANTLAMNTFQRTILNSSLSISTQ